MRLRNKIVIPSAAIGALLLILGLSGAWYVLRLQRSNSRLLDVNVSSIRAAGEIEVQVRQLRHELNQFVLAGDRGRLDRATEIERDLTPWREQARRLAVSARERALVANLDRALDTFFSRLRELIDAPAGAVDGGAVQQLVKNVLTDEALAQARLLVDLNEAELQSSNEQNQAMAERLALALLLLGTCGAIAGLVAGCGIARGISRSIFQLSVPIRDVAGKLNQVVGPVEVAGDPSVADLEMVLQSVSAKVGAVVEQLHARHREVIRADQLAALGQLAAGLAHELRNPLMCMKTLVQSARRRGKAARLDACDLAVLDEEISRLETLLQAFLDFARPANPEVHDFDLAQVVRQTVALLSGRAEARDVAVICRLPDEPLAVRGDVTHLRQVLVNLLLNALDAVPNGGAIWIDAAPGTNGRAGTKPEVQRRPCVCLRVADNGRGLPAEGRNRIYEPFFSTKETGLGLGLAISRRIVDAHGGDLVALDREGGGAIFEIRLPAPR